MHGGAVSSLLYATPPPSRNGPKAPPRGGGGGRLEGGFREGRWGAAGRVGWGGGVQVGQFGVGGGGGWHKVGLNIIRQISFMAAFATSLLSILDPNTHSNPSLG